MRTNGLSNWAKKTPALFAIILALLVVSFGTSGVQAAGSRESAEDTTSNAYTATYRSIGTQDGWILESSEISNIGQMVNKTAATLILGDNPARKQYRSVLSFNTASLPDNAVITSVSLQVKRKSITGTGNPISLFGGFMADVKTGSFTTPALVRSDFQTKPSGVYGPLKYTFANGWYRLNLSNAKTLINKTSVAGGLTQIRLRFKVGDNNNNIANTLSLLSGNAGAASRPRLVITYNINATPTATASQTNTATATDTETQIPTATASATDTETLTATEEATSTPSLTPTISETPSDTNTPTHTLTPSESPTATETNTPEACGTTNFALGKTATALSSLGGNTASKAVDGAAGTRWESVHNVDPQWIQIDLGAPQRICGVKLNWEGAYGKDYQIQVSEDGTAWTTLADVVDGNGGIDDLSGLSGIGRYIRMFGTERGLPYGYSLWEFEVYVGTAPTLTPTPTGPTPTLTPSLTPTITFTPTITNTPIDPQDCGTTNMAINRPATASSSVGAASASKAVDGFSGTRWESAQGIDPQWIQLDFGTPAIICRVVLNWEVAAASAFHLQTSNDGATWSSIYVVNGASGGLQDLEVGGLGRYLRVYGTARTTPYGYSLWEIEVYGSGGDTLPTPTPIPTIQSAPVDFGPNVVIFDPSMSAATIQDRLDLVFAQQQTNQFGPQRDALLFKPGTYNVNASIGFNTQIAGLGFSPDDVVINGLVNVEADWFGGNATQNFWRIAENMKIIPTGGTNRWGVSQAAPFRRMHVVGNLQIDPRDHGWSSGGFLVDSKIEGQVASGSQQQYMSRNNQINSWSNCVWNCVFVGTSGAPAESFPNPPYTTIAQTPLVREKPFLYVDSNDDYFVFVPAMRTNATGTSWDGQTPAGTSLPISDFYIVKVGDTAASINTALANGKHLLVTPGVYHLNQTIHISNPNTVVLGLGLATFINDNGVIAMQVDDVDGVKIAGILFDAGTTNAPVLLEVGPTGSSADHSANPTQLSDVFVRVGGAVAGKVEVGVIINSDDVIVDHTWIWRGDHGAGIGWTVNTSKNGLIVNGDDVTIYGLFVEHFQEYNVVWNGNGGRTYFFQNEIAYDPPNQAAFMNGTTKGYAAYKVADTVTTHEAWGLGSYCYFNVDPTIQVDQSFEAPNVPGGVLFHNLSTISLGNNGTILSVINGVGDPTSTNTTPSTVVSYP